MKKGVVATGNRDTTRAALEILEEGGNAYDAILASLCMAPLSEPVLASLGGGGHMLSQRKDGTSIVYDFFAHTPGSKKIDANKLDFHSAVIDFGSTTQEFHIGTASIAIPGNIRGLFEIHRELGSIPMKRIVEPAIRAARDGVEVDDLQASIIDLVAPIMNSSVECKKLYGSSAELGKLLRAKESYTNIAYAEILEALSCEGDRLFYEGDIAKKIAADIQERGGYIRADDLAAYRVLKREPISIGYRGAEFITNPPPSSGGILIAFALRLLESGDLNKSIRRGEYIYRLARVMSITNKARVDELNGNLFKEHIVPTFLDHELVKRYSSEVWGVTQNNRGTSHMSVIDAEGNIASLTTSNGEGSGYIVPGTGIHLNNMLGEEDLHPGGFHMWNENERISSMMSPSILNLEDGRVVALGSGGSNRIRTAILQVIINMVDRGMNIHDAITSPRIHFERDALNIEPGFDEQEIILAQSLYGDTTLWDKKSMYFGGVHGVVHDPSEQYFNGCGDDRRGGNAAVV